MTNKKIPDILSALKKFFAQIRTWHLNSMIQNEITVNLLRELRGRPENKIVIAKKECIMKALQESDQELKSLELPGNARVILAEYDPDRDEILNIFFSESEGELKDVLDENDGIVIIE